MLDGFLFSNNDSSLTTLFARSTGLYRGTRYGFSRNSLQAAAGFHNLRHAIDFRRACSSAGQSGGLIIHWSWVRTPPCPPFFCCSMTSCARSSVGRASDFCYGSFTRKLVSNNGVNSMNGLLLTSDLTLSEASKEERAETIITHLTM